MPTSTFFNFRFYFSIAVIAVAALSACSSAPTAQETVAAYQRTQRSVTNPGGDFGNISDRSLSLTLNPQLLWAQAHQQCDQKPVAYRTNDPQKLREIKLKQRETDKTCRRSDNFIGCAISQSQLDSANASLNVVQYQQDCYMAAPPAELTGKLQLRLVDKSTNISSYSAAPIIASFTLTQEAKPVSFDLPANLDGSKCLALTDIQGTAIKVRDRGSNGDNYTFATPQMRSVKDRAALQERIKAAQDGLQKQQAQIQDIKSQLLEEPGLKRNSDGSYQCVRPAQRPLPPAPTGGLSWNAATQQAQGYCFEKLANNFSPDLVFEYVKAAEEDQYISSYKAYANNKNSCTRKAYEYDPYDLQIMRMFSKINPRENEKRQVISMLDGCAQSVLRRCASDLIEWQSEVARIKAEPDQIYESCSEKLVNFAVAGKTLENMMEQLNNMKAQLNTYQTSSADSAFVPLSAALCEARP